MGDERTCEQRVEEYVRPREQSCEERIQGHLKSRIEDIAALNELASVYDEDDLREALETPATRELYEEIKPDDFEEITAGDFSELNDAARERIQEYPLGVSSQTVFRVDLSTGGPGDWFEVFCSGDTPNYEPLGNGEYYEVQRIVYHFNDWFDHAERELTDSEFQAAEVFVSEVISELVG